MHNLRAMNIVFSSVKRSFCTVSISKLHSCLKLVKFNEKFSKVNYKLIHSNFRLLSSEAAAEQSNKNHQNVDQCDELDSKIGLYAELAMDSEQKKKILMILMEHEVAHLEGKRVPAKITIDDMKELLSMYSFSSRVKYMGFLWDKESRKDNDRRKREFKRKEREAWLIEKQTLRPADHIQYGIGHNTLVLRVRKRSVLRFSNQRLANAILYGQKIIVDMDYDCFMRKQDCTSCGEQLLELYSSNRKNRNPYDLVFCNVDFTSTTMATFRRYMANLYSPDNFIALSNSNYLDLFPKEKLIYITPYAKEPLKNYDHNAIYIIGGLIDKCIKEPVVLAKAKREGIKAVHLPFDEYLMWGRSNKSLPLNQIMEILLEMKATEDWNKAFRFVPQRKLVRSLDLFSEF